MATMAGTPTSAKGRRFGGGKVRDVDVVGAPAHVSSDATSGPSAERALRLGEFGPASRITLAQRPSTSGGTASKKIIDKHQTRDDLPFNPLAAHKIGNTYYNFPVAAHSPASLITSDLPLRKSSLPRSLTPEQDPAVTVVDSDDMEIGMAIGSPSHPPAAWQPTVRFEASDRTESPEHLDPVVDWREANAGSKPKASRWKTFGGLFGKKSAQAPAFYQLQNEEGDANESDQGYTTSPAAPDKVRGRARTNSERKPNQRPEVKRAATAPLDFEFERSDRQPKPAMPTPELRLDGGPMLNVDIPSIEMERYSIMFGSVLKPNPSSASSLLARRQATLDKLKTVNEAIAEHERHEAETRSKLLRPRRATSPQPTKSPAFSLFPPSRDQRSNTPPTPRKNPLQLYRSNTSPAALSPNRQTFEPPRPVAKEIDPDAMIHVTPLAPTPPVRSLIITQPAPPITSATLSEPWSPEQSHLILGSPTDSINEIYDSNPLRPRLVEPTWEMIPRSSSSALPTPPDSNSSVSSNDTNDAKSEPLKSRHNVQGSGSKSSSKSTSKSGFTVATTVTTISSAASPPLPQKSPIQQQRQRAQSTASKKSVPQILGSNTYIPPNPRPIKTAVPIAIPRANASSSSLSKSKPPPTAASLQDSVEKLMAKEAEAETLASISIARQISVSQRQRQLLVPIKSRSAAAAGNAQTPGSVAHTPSAQKDDVEKTGQVQARELPLLQKSSPAPTTSSQRTQQQQQQEQPQTSLAPPPSSTQPLASPKRYGSVRAARENMRLAGLGNGMAGLVNHDMAVPLPMPGERANGERVWVNEKKPLTPTLVEVGLGGSGSGNGGLGAYHGHVYRKSERVVFERA